MRRADAAALAAWLLLALLACLPITAVADAPLRVGLLTMEPGVEFWERFGHDAILIEDRATGEGVSYNYGFFDMDEPGFIGNFVRGRMNYLLVALPVQEDLNSYREEGRGVTVQWLNIDAAHANALAAALAENARPENSRYRYEYYTANCATKVRDRVDQALGGLLEKQLSGRSQGNTYRSESVRLAWPAKWMALGFDLGLAGPADRPLTRWEEAFIPMRLRDSLREVKLANGQPLVQSEQIVLPHRLPQPPVETPHWRIAALLLGIALATGVLMLGSRRPRLLAALALPFWLLAGVLGGVMTFLWLGSEHVFAHGNQNLLLLSPLCLLLLPGGWQVARGRAASPAYRFLLWAIAGMAAIAGFLKFLPFLPQQNLEWVLLLLPLHWALARALDKRLETGSDPFSSRKGI
jgi:hypothetical protein